MALVGFTPSAFTERRPPPRSSGARGIALGAGAPTSRGPTSLAAQLAAAAALPSAPRVATYIRKVGQPLSATPWDPLLPVPPGYELVSVIEARDERALIEKGKRARNPRAGDVSVAAVPSLPGERREAQRQRTERRAAARRERREQLKRKRGAAVSARAARAARPPRVPRPPRASRRPRRPRRPRPARNSRPPRPSKPKPFLRKRPVGLCKLSDDTGGCWNAGTCGPSPTGGPGVFGHCIFAASED